MGKRRTWGRWRNTGAPPREGGQGRVFIVVDTDMADDNRFALKELKNPRRLDRFRQEVRAFAELGLHPNLIVIVDAVLDDDVEKKYYVMELADSSLEDAVDDLSGETRRALELFEGICSGMAHLHAHGILHRDIKPANVLLIGDVPKLSDLGLCLIAKNEHRLTPTDEAVGPRYFMAPELEDGRNPDVDASADVYSLGKLLYYLLADGRVYSREKRYFQENRLSELLVDPRFKPFDALLRKCITERPQERFSSAAELLTAFKRARNAFDVHPRSTLLEKLPGLLEIAASVDASALELLTDEELREYLLLVRESMAVPSDAVLDWFSGRSADAYVHELMKVVCPLIDELSPALTARLGVKVMRHDEAWSLLGTGCTDSQFETLVFRAIVDMEDAEVLRKAAHHAFPGKSMPSVLPEIQKRFDRMGLAEQKAFVALTMQTNWEGKSEWLMGQLDEFREDVVLFEGALCSLFKFGEDTVQCELVQLGLEMRSDDEIGAYGRAMTECALPNVVNRVAHLKGIDPRLRILSEIRQQIDSGDEFNLDLIRDRYMDGDLEPDASNDS